jgi:magnesium chelatase family protein
MNPCPCGNFGNSEKECTCLPLQLIKYQKKISGPIIDRIDLWLEVSKVDHRALGEHHKAESSDDVKKRVLRAREIQTKRFSNKKTLTKNSDMSAKDIETYVNMTTEAKEMLILSAERMRLSARAHHKLIKLAQTIADLVESKKIEVAHILEALQYRPKK